jgi:hypothetical protein
MVVLQCMVAVGVALGTVFPACGSSDQCHQAGTYCMIGKYDRCSSCGDDHPLPPQIDPATGGALNNPDAPDFAGFNLTAVAQLCADPSLSVGDVGPRGSGHVASSIVSWCKSDNASLGLFIPGPFLAHDKCRSQARPAFIRSTARWTR